jgi:hypothetical protein
MNVPIVRIFLIPFVLAFVPLGCKAESASTDTTCSPTACMVNQNTCGKAACMIPPGGGNAVCEYAPKLTGSCRCWPGDKRPCTLSGGGSGLKTCQAGGSGDTYWGTCS